MNIDLADLSARQKKLEDAKIQLKKEFFGLDGIIDRVIDSLYAWYVFPQLITRPVVINLWGMTGVGKTQVARRIAHLLGFFDRFVEVQMDSLSGGSGFYQSSIASILRDSSIEEGRPGILLLDEMQRFRTIDEHGQDVKVYRFQDVWMLLSDGRFAADSTIFREVEDILMQQAWSQDRRDHPDDDGENEDTPKNPAVLTTAGSNAAPKSPRRFSFSPWEAQQFKRLLKLNEPTQEIMTWSMTRVQSELMTIRQKMASWEIDYSKLLIFVSGNLDEAFPGAQATEDCDTDADIYHDLTSKVTTTEIKQALAERFRPEQVARLGNNHIIYPSLSRNSYMSLIERTCQEYLKEMEEISGLKFEVDPQIYQEIYDNAVYPTQGTRPVFSSVHKIFSGALSNIAVWAVENKLSKIKLTLDVESQRLYGISGKKKFFYPVELEIRTNRHRNTIDFNTLVSVHEAGHAILYAALFKKAPMEVKTNLASFAGGYNFYEKEIISNRDMLTKRIAVSFGGIVAEELVFGRARRSTGCRKDILMATTHAAQFVREHGFSDTTSYIAEANMLGPEYRSNTDVKGSNVKVEQICGECMMLAERTLRENLPAFTCIVNVLLKDAKLSPEDFKLLMQDYLTLQEDETPHVHDWEQFAKEQQLREEAAEIMAG